MATHISNVSLPSTPRGSTWDLSLQNGRVTSISAHNSSHPSSAGAVNGHGALLAPSLCHPHIHLDKPFLLSHPKYANLQPDTGDFQEAMTLTSAAKAQFEEWDLLERGRRLLDESLAAGVTHLRAFVELDAGVGTLCLAAGLALKREYADRCHIQLCAFAQLPLFSRSPSDDDGAQIRALIAAAAQNPAVDALGSTPYVERDRARAEQNVAWITALAITHNKHLDLHLDYHVDAATQPLVWHVLATLHALAWPASRTVALGHCTRLTLFTPAQWQRLRAESRALPLHFVGLPSSDVYMLGDGATLAQPRLVREHALQCCVGVNNVGNAFTPQGSCDPLALAGWAVGVYQAGGERDAEVVYEGISTRAREAVGLGRGDGRVDLEVRVGDEAHLVLFGRELVEWRTRRRVGEVVCLLDAGRGRRAFYGGSLTAGA